MLKQKKTFSLIWVFEDLEGDPSFATKRMFGGLAVYYRGKMVYVLTEDPGGREYRGMTFDFDVWNGLLIFTDREFHEFLFL